jgi:uroporphyrinogen decarboxylase
MYRKLHIDGRRGAGPVWRGQPRADGADIWGVRYREINYGTGSYSEPAEHPLAAADSVSQIHAYPWPSPDEFDYSTIGPWLAADDGFRLISAGGYEPFLLYAYMRGLEQTFEDLLVNPEIADAILGHLFDFHYEHLRRTFQAGNGKIDITYIAEDLGSQSGPLMSLETYRRFLLPNQIKMADLARSYNVHVMYHTDGAARAFLPDLIDRVGIEVLNPIQWRCCGMEREGLVRDFGRQLIFHGAVDNQQTLPFGSAQDVSAEVRENLKLFTGAGARWVCAPCHNLQPVTPTANVVAMYQTIREIGKL